MIASATDDKRRLTMPKELPPKFAVTIQQLNEDSWLVTRQKPKTESLIDRVRPDTQKHPGFFI